MDMPHVLKVNDPAALSTFCYCTYNEQHDSAHGGDHSRICAWLDSLYRVNFMWYWQNFFHKNSMFKAPTAAEVKQWLDKGEVQPRYRDLTEAVLRKLKAISNTPLSDEEKDD
jgi:hypothetical protein